MSPPTFANPRSAAAIGTHALQYLSGDGLLRLGVPVALGGVGGGPSAVGEAARRLLVRDPAAAWVYRAQRLAIELLVHANNIGLREHLLPQLLAGERAGTVPMPMEAHPLVAIEAGNAMRLYGQYSRVVNLQWVGFSVAVPIQAGATVEWALLRGEEDGLRIGIDHGEPCPAGSRAATLTFDGVFFRMDEWLGEATLPQRVAPLAEVLAQAVPMPACA